VWIDDEAWPYPHHPVRLVGNVLEPDTSVTRQVFQLRPLTVDACQAWCGGEVVMHDGGPAIIVPGGGGVAELGDFIVDVLGVFEVELAAGFAQRYAPVTS